MNTQRPLLLIVLLAYIFMPTFYGWVTDAAGAWYKPFVIWALVVVIAYVIQARRPQNDF